MCATANVHDEQVTPGSSFLPEVSFGLQVLSLPASVRPSITKFVRAKTHHPFKLE